MIRIISRRLVSSWPWAGTAALLLVALSASSGALPPPADRFDHGAAGTARNGSGGKIAPAPSGGSWPGTANSGNGGPFGFVGAQYGDLWGLPLGANNSLGVGYCVMEDVLGTGRVGRQPDPAEWDEGEMARAAAVMATFGGDRVVPYGIGPDGAYDVDTGEWHHPALFGGGEYTRRRQIAVNFAVRMFVEDMSPSGAARGRKLARDTAIVSGSDGNFSALRNGYLMAQRLAQTADIQAAVGGVSLEMVWGTPGGMPPTAPGTYPLDVRVRDGNGKPVGWVPVLQLSSSGIDDNRSVGAIARVDQSGDAPDGAARWNAASAAGWPVWGMNHSLHTDARFMVGGASGIAPDAAARTADVADARGIARFDVTISKPSWELAFHVQAPTADIELWAGTGLQGQITWTGRPQSASVHAEHHPPELYVAIEKLSIEPSLSVAGSEFALVDANGAQVDSGAVGADASLRFAPIDPVAHPGPYVVRELRAAPGLARRDDDIAVPGPVSTDASSPTVVVVRNAPIIGLLRVRKVFDHDDVVGGRDLSGFVFAVHRVGSADEPVIVATDPDGRSDPIEVVLGRYSVEELDRPAWAMGSFGAAVEVAVDPSAEPSVEVAYENTMPEATIDTFASDAADGDGYLDALRPDAAIVDRVELCGLVPGTAYVLHGDVLRLTESSVVPTEATSSIEIVADSTCTATEMVIDIPADVAETIAGSSVVVYQQLTVASSARVVATHGDPTDADQTIRVPAVTTSLRAVSAQTPSDTRQPAEFLVTPGTQLLDRLTYRGLAPGAEYIASTSLARQHADGTCGDGVVVGRTSFVAEAGSGVVEVPAGSVPSPGVFAVSQHIAHADAPDAPEVVTHDGCADREQTVWSIGVDTAVEHAVVSGEGVMRDRISVHGLEVPIPGVAALSIEGGLYAHDDDADRSGWDCTDANRIAAIEVTIDDSAMDGFAADISTPGEAHGLGWHSYDVRVVIGFDDATSWSSASHGCRLPAESFHARTPTASTTPTPSTRPSTAVTTVPLSIAPPTPPTSTPSGSTWATSPPSAPRPLPTTGGGSMRLTIAVAGLLLAVGAVTLAASRRTPQ
ncbi:MAG: VaFE repeat-containing surface-anchored protein [Actinomycetota bacterium]